jgi:RNA-directed DNA polymerase
MIWHLVKVGCISSQKNSSLTLWKIYAMKERVIIQKANQLSTIKNAAELGVLLKTHPASLALLCLQPHYKTYRIPKKNGQYRIIEDPEKKLKTVQRNLNHYLQAWYYTIKTNAVHGFCISAEDEEAKGIYSNAMAHIGKPYLINIDMQDFFHQVTYDDVCKSLVAILKKANKETIKTIAQLTTYNKRLPMGAPTSPVLANICSGELDDTLINVCKNINLTYTRYADDLSFSATKPITKLDREILETSIIQQGFDINHNKTKLYTEKETKMVTGLVLKKDGVALPPFYLPQLIREIEKYNTIKEVEYRYQTGMSNKKLKLFEQELMGKINFAEIILGSGNELLQPVYQKWLTATAPLHNFESTDWLDIPYNFF